MEEKLVYTGTNNIEVEHICSILKENDIVFTKKTEGAGDYLTIAAGNLFNCNTKIFVSEEQYEKANELIKFVSSNNAKMEIPEELKDISAEEEKEMDEEAKKIKISLKLFIFLFVLCPSLFLIIAVIIRMLQN
jgi:hypothetical protein